MKRSWGWSAVPRAMRCAPRLAEDIQPGAVQPKRRAVDQSVLSQGPAREFWKARADAVAGADECCRRDAAGLGRRVLGREPAAGAPALGAVSAGGGDHRAPDVCRTGLRASAVVSQPGGHRGHGRAARAVVSRRSCAACRCAGDRRGRGYLARNSAGRRSRDTEAGVPGKFPAAVPRRAGSAARVAAEVGVLDLDEPDRHPRLPQPLRLLLSLDRRAGHALPGAGCRANCGGIPG